MMGTGITSAREALAGIPGADELVMRYEDGGAVQAFSIGDVTVRLGPLATLDQLREAFEAERTKQLRGMG